MAQSCCSKLFFAGFLSIFLVTGCSHGQSLADPIKTGSREDFSAIAAAVNEKTKEIMQDAQRSKIPRQGTAIIEYAYPKQQPRYVLPLPHHSAVAKDELRVLCRFLPGESFVLVACDRSSPEGTIYVFTTQAIYIISGKTFACHMRNASLYNAFEGDPYAYAVSYGELPALVYQDTDSQEWVTMPDGRVLKISKESGIPACLDAAVACLKNPSEKQIDKRPELEFIKGHTLIVPYLDANATAKLRESMEKLAQTNADTVCLAIMSEMETFNTPDIRWGKEVNFPDEMLLEAIQIARDNNLKIVLKPMVNCKDTIWRAWIEFTDDAGRQDLAAWGKWWDEYSRFILHYVKIAEQTRCEMVCLGCEMSSTEPFETRWRQLIHDTRRIYNGLLTYNVNHGKQDDVRFWDALDVIGMSGYYYLGYYMQMAGIKGADKPDYQVTLDDLRIAWKPIRQELKQTSEKWKKPVFFIECGVCSAEGVSRTPWQHSSPELVYDGQEQADFYQAVFETFWNEPWFMGFTWWAWPPALYSCQDVEKQVNFEIYCKPAEDVVKKWYAEERPFNFPY